jgi:hypothetical protein
MKKIFLLLLLLPLLFSFKVAAGFTELPKPQLPAGYGDAWVGEYYCLEPNTLSFKEAQQAGMMQIPYSGEEARLMKEAYGYCINTSPNRIAAIHDYNDRILTGDNRRVIFCENVPAESGYIVGRRGKAPASYTEYIRFVGNVNIGVCCPVTHPYNYEGTAWDHNRCCSQPNLDGVDDNKCGSYETGVAPTDFKEASPSDTNYFTVGTAKYSCGMNDCLVGPLNPTATVDSFLLNVPKGMYTQAELDAKRLKCYLETDTGDFTTSTTPTTFPVDGQPYYCLTGEGITPSEWAEWQTKMPGFLACRKFIDPNDPDDKREFNLCTSCLKQCETCVYSSLGCIDTTMNGVITTIMRIGIGILGAVGIFRIMQAAVLRQSADPKDIQESWDIIISVIMGTIVLLGSMVILRVIGINILGILPFDF